MKRTLLRRAALTLCLSAGVARAEVLYVWKDNPSAPVPPYTGGWDSAATNIQDAVDAASAGDTILVTNGVYNSGGRGAPGETTLKTRVVVDKAIILQSVNGPEVTLISGAHNGTGNGLGNSALRAIYLTNSAVLSGFTVTNGYTRSGTTAASEYYGGGVLSADSSAWITNCLILGNAAAMRGGGVYQGTLGSCLVGSNAVLAASASAAGGGAYNVTAFATRFELNKAAYSSADGGGTYSSVLQDCTVATNSAGRNGGGVYLTTLTSCTVEGNVAGTSGGGAYGSSLVTNSIIRGNRAGSYGGGIYGINSAKYYDCRIESNRVTVSGSDGGGIYAYTAQQEFYRCRILDNEAVDSGGGACQGRFFSCVFSGNRAARAGGAYLASTTYQLNSCTVMGNTGTTQYGGTYYGTVSNSIVYGNSAPSSANYSSGTFVFSCADPLPTGSNNTNVNPLVSGYRDPHLLPGSPCIGTGRVSGWMAASGDIDGDPREAGGSTDRGADQYTADGLSGPLEAAIIGDAVCVVGFPLTFRSEVSGRVGGLIWDFGDGIGQITNQNPVTYTYCATGEYVLRLTVTNSTDSAEATLNVQVINPPNCYVSLAGHHVFPFDSWDNAATNIQDALDAALDGSTILVTNGVYSLGGRAVTGQSVVNRACVDRSLRLMSVEGPEATVIVGKGTGVGASSERGVYLAETASLCGFTVSNGFTRSGTTLSDDYYGGGVLCAGLGSLVSNCIIRANGAAMHGGGVCRGTLIGCLVATNQVVASSSNAGGGGAYSVTALATRFECNAATYTSADGGGAYASVLLDCTVATNTAGRYGGGVYMSTLTSCTVDGNMAGTSGGGAYLPISVSNCVVRGNLASTAGGGIYQSLVQDSQILSNRVTGAAGDGGGFYGTAATYILLRCVIDGNEAVRNGGGVYNAVLSNCLVRANRSTTGSGGGYYTSTATGYQVANTRFLDNEAYYRGGGAFQGKFFGCVFSGNASAEGGGAYLASTSYQLNSCSVLGNWASAQYGGVYSGTVKSSIVSGNEAPAYANWASCSFSFSCADPLPTSGSGNTNETPYVSGYREPHLLSSSPLIGKGFVEAWMDEALDMDDEPRVSGSQTDMGADQYWAGGLTGPLSVSIVAATNVCAVGWPFAFRAETTGLPEELIWDLGDGSSPVENVNPVVAAFSAPGSYTVRVTVSNATHSATATYVIQAQWPGVFYVSAAGSGSYPFGSWETAATNLQDAIDAAALVPGSSVLATDGVYAAGGRIAPGQSVTNRAYVAPQTALRSVNGPAFTVIAGAPHAGSADGGLGDGALRGVYLAEGASLSGFTVSNGFTRSGTTVGYDYFGGGVFCGTNSAVISNCLVIGNSAAMRGGGVYRGCLVNASCLANVIRANSSSAYGGGLCEVTAAGCEVSGNQTLGASADGAGSAYCSLTNCVLQNNVSARNGGAASDCALAGCLVDGNTAVLQGGGVYDTTLTGCVVRANLVTGNSDTTGEGGGFYASGSSYTAHGCRFIENEAHYRGGGAYQGRFYSCVFGGNRAMEGGAFYGSSSYWLTSCTVMRNTAANLCGGTYQGTLKNCIVYGNESPVVPNWYNATFSYSCADPLPPGDGNLCTNPVVSGYLNPHLLSGSPLIGAGTVESWMAAAQDIDGGPRLTGGLADIGADQYDAGALEGGLSVRIVTSTNVCVAGWPQDFLADTEGFAAGLEWDFGDGSGLQADLNPVSHAFLAPGEYAVRVTVTNATDSAVATQVMQVVVAPVVYVSPSGGHVYPFSAWDTAATNLQDAVDAAALAGSQVLVTNGVYDAGGRPAPGQALTNRVLIQRAIHISSVNGSSSTFIVGTADAASANGGLGDAAARGVYLASGATLCGFTVSNGFTRSGAFTSGDYCGGGILCASESSLVLDCAVSGCRAYSRGGGIYQGYARDCRIENNVVLVSGGGACNASLSNCLVRANQSAGTGGSMTGQGGGVYAESVSVRFDVCRLLDNQANYQGGGAYQGTFYSCVFSGNRAATGGGGYGDMESLLLNSCSVQGNAASVRAGGIYSATVRNGIVYGNDAPSDANTYSASITYSCTEKAGTGNLDVYPMVSGYRDPHLLPGSPLIGQGISESWMAGACDLDGEPRGTDMGADEFFADALEGPLTVSIVSATNVCAVGWPHAFRAEAEGKVSGVVWDFGDGGAATGNTLVSHPFGAAGTYTVGVTVTNRTHSASATFEVTAIDYARYVSLSGGHEPPFDTWEKAATNIQDAVDAVDLAGGCVWVAAGVYSTGGRKVGAEAVTNRVVITNAVRLVSVDGPTATVIAGLASPTGDPANGGLGEGTVRCLRLSGGGQVSGFTLTNGFTRWTSGISSSADYSGGGAYCADTGVLISNCVVAGCKAACYGGGIRGGTVRNSVIGSNEVRNNYGLGGGIYKGNVHNSAIRANSAGSGGGYASDGTSEAARACLIADNVAQTGGGGYRGMYYDCLFTNNAAEGGTSGDGGGFYMPTGFTPASALYRCRLVANQASHNGGGACGSATYYSCSFSGNEAEANGGGVYGGTLEYCSVLGNRAAYGGGALGSDAYYSLLYYNTASLYGDNTRACAVYGCCSFPAGDGVIVTNAPLVAGFASPHLLPGSPCIDAGDYRAWVSGSEGLDLDGEARLDGPVPDLGADECHTNSLAGPLSVSVVADYSVFGKDYAPLLRAEISGFAGSISWDFGDGSGGSGLNPVRHAFGGLGEYTVRATVSNLTDSAWGEVTLTVVDGNTFVSLSGGHVPPFASWETAATNIQDAVDAALVGGTVWVTNGVYESGGRPAFGYGLTNRVCIEDKTLTVRSVSGPEQTVIRGKWHSASQKSGDGAVRGVWIDGCALLIGFTVTNGATRESGYLEGTECSGGGVYSSADGCVSNCWVRGCSSDDTGGGGFGGRWLESDVSSCWAYFGGGLAAATAAGSTLSGNTAGWDGGGASECVMSNCVLTGNWAYEGDGGGATESELTDCSLSGNAAGDGGGAYGGTLVQCALTGNSAVYGGASEYATLDACLLSGNQASYGGASFDSWHEGCTVTGNTASAHGGGGYYGVFRNCVIAWNSAQGGNGGGFATQGSGDWLEGCSVFGNTAALDGGGCYGGTLYDCSLTNNAARSGGGYYLPLARSDGELYRCRITDNHASANGGGSYGASLFSCVVAYNAAAGSGGGAYSSSLESCSVLGNSAGGGGGCAGGEAWNTVIYFNSAPFNPDAEDTACADCCLPGEGSVTAAPQVFGFRQPHLLPGSPCIDAGAARSWMSLGQGYDMDGESRVVGAAPDIGADEWPAAVDTGRLDIVLSVASLTNATSYAVPFFAEVSGWPSSLVWDFGDGSGDTNRNPAAHAFLSAGTYTVRATVSNSTDGASAELQVTVLAGNAYVALNGAHVAPFTSWETAATNIQDAVDAVPWGGNVWIADGTYERGGRPAAGQALTNRVCVEKAAALVGVNGPSAVTVRGSRHSEEIDFGPGAVRGVYLGHRESSLSGVTVADGATSDADETEGGGVYCAAGLCAVSNCVVSGCGAYADGGGVRAGSLYGCLLSGNEADGGGGAYRSSLSWCLVSNNVAFTAGGGAKNAALSDSQVVANQAAMGSGGGLSEAEAVRCVVSSNEAWEEGGGAFGGALMSCLLTKNVADTGGGASDATVDGCTVVGNAAGSAGGGVAWSTVYNSILWNNSASEGSNTTSSACGYSLAVPLPTGGYDLGGNLASDPRFMNAMAGNYRLRGTSPCINKGTNIWYAAEDGATDLDGFSRVYAGFVDMGAYECTSVVANAALGTPIDWLADYGLGPDWDAAELDDPDHDGFLTWEEYITLTDPTDGGSFFAVYSISKAGPSAFISFTTALDRVYTVEHSASLLPVSWSDAASPVQGDGTRMTVEVPESGSPWYYRVRVALP